MDTIIFASDAIEKTNNAITRKHELTRQRILESVELAKVFKVIFTEIHKKSDDGESECYVEIYNLATKKIPISEIIKLLIKLGYYADEYVFDISIRIKW
jgi:hypothetical protein